jgi:hypothetical protein
VAETAEPVVQLTSPDKMELLEIQEALELKEQPIPVEVVVEEVVVVESLVLESVVQVV